LRGGWLRAPDEHAGPERAAWANKEGSSLGELPPRSNPAQTSGQQVGPMAAARVRRPQAGRTRQLRKALPVGGAVLQHGRQQLQHGHRARRLLRAAVAGRRVCTTLGRWCY